MTKTLTEQWKDGELEWGLYYVKTKKDAPLFCGEITEMSLGEEITISQMEKVESVLAPVPSYDEYCNLVFQANKPKNPLSDAMMCYDTEREKKVVERLQEQLNEANEVIISVAVMPRFPVNPELCREYLKKWGVK